MSLNLPRPALLSPIANWLSQLNGRRLKARRQRKDARAYQDLLKREQREASARPIDLNDPSLSLRITLIFLPESKASQVLADQLTELQAQQHGNWELLTDRGPAGTPPPTDPRCRWFSTPPEADLAHRYNALLAEARGDYVVLLRESDRLAGPHALRLWAEAAQHFHRPPVVYSDEDRVDQAGRHHRPHFKCDWNQELQRAAHALGRSWLVRTDRARQVGGWPELPEPGAAQLLVLAACGNHERCPAVHVPHVLWHWQAPSNCPTTEPTSIAQAQAVQRLLRSQGVNCTVRPAPDVGLHVRYAVPEPAPLVSLIVPTRNGLHLLRQCVESVLKHTRYPNFELLIVDNGSDDPATLDYLAQRTGDARVRVRRDARPFNYSALNNHALADCRGELICLLNNDTEVISPHWLDEMVALACRADVGVVGARLWFGNGTLQHAGVLLGLGGYAGHLHLDLPRGQTGYFGRACLTQEFSAVTAACLVMRRCVFDAVGGLNEENLGIDLNDVDLCLRVREAGWRVVWTPFAELFHHESASRGKTLSAERRARQQAEQAWFAKRWSHWLHADPAYHPSLSLRREAFALDEVSRVSTATPWYLAPNPTRPLSPPAGR